MIRIKKELKDYISPFAYVFRLQPMNLMDSFSVEGDIDQFQDEDLGDTTDPF